jgi:hypothetical protein
VPGDGFGGDFVESRNFTDIKAMNNAGGDGTCDLDNILCGQLCKLAASRSPASEEEVHFFQLVGNNFKHLIDINGFD